METLIVQIILTRSVIAVSFFHVVCWLFVAISSIFPKIVVQSDFFRKRMLRTWSTMRWNRYMHKSWTDMWRWHAMQVRRRWEQLRRYMSRRRIMVWREEKMFTQVANLRWNPKLPGWQGWNGMGEECYSHLQCESNFKIQTLSKSSQQFFHFSVEFNATMLHYYEFLWDFCGVQWQFKKY